MHQISFAYVCTSVRSHYFVARGNWRVCVQKLLEFMKYIWTTTMTTTKMTTQNWPQKQLNANYVEFFRFFFVLFSYRDVRVGFDVTWQSLAECLNHIIEIGNGTRCCLLPGHRAFPSRFLVIVAVVGVTHCHHHRTRMPIFTKTKIAPHKRTVLEKHLNCFVIFLALSNGCVYVTSTAAARKKKNIQRLLRHFSHVSSATQSQAEQVWHIPFSYTTNSTFIRSSFSFYAFLSLIYV